MGTTLIWTWFIHKPMTFFKNGFKYWFDTEEAEQVIENNLQYEVTSYVEELILKWLEPVDPEKEEPQHKWTSTEISEYLSGKSNLPVNDSTIQKVGKYMKRIVLKE